MKKILFFVFVLASILNGSKEYNLKYEIFNDGEQIGTLEALSIKNSEGIFKYSTRFDVEMSYLFMEFNYLYVEDAYVEGDEVVSLFVYEKEDDDIQKAKAVKNGDHLVYGDGTKVELSKIDYFPFDFIPNIEKKLEQKEFTLKTFDTLSGKVVIEKNTITKKQDGKYYIETISLDDSKDEQKEEKVISKDGIVEYMKNKYFEARLVN